MSPRSHTAIRASLAAGLIGGGVSAALHGWIAPFPSGPAANALQHGVTGFMSGFMGLFMHLRLIGKAGP